MMMMMMMLPGHIQQITYLEPVYAFYFLFQGFRYKFMLFHNRKSFESLTCNGDRVKRATSS